MCMHMHMHMYMCMCACTCYKPETLNSLKMGRSLGPPKLGCCVKYVVAVMASPGGHSGPGMGKIQRVQEMTSNEVTGD